jgi:serine/threonine protein kinase
MAREKTTQPGRLADGTPERLGRYRLVRPLSTGGMAHVFEGRRESLAGVAPRVAIKVILPEYAKDDGFQKLFQNEAVVGSQLHHQNIVQIQDFDYADGRLYLVMEYVDGITLRRVVNICRRNGIAIPLELVLEIGRQVSDGLQYAHAAPNEDGRPLGLVHRDVKPSNLMLNPQGVVKLLDFGISVALVASSDAAVRGTWGYMSPEQSAGEALDARSDLFGLAAVLYELAALDTLFPEKEPADIQALMAHDEAARRANALTGSYAPLAPILVRALQRDPEARFATAHAMGKALTALLPDPVVAREHLLRFQAQMIELSEGGAGPARERPRSASTFATPARPALPVSVGNALHPYLLSSATGGEPRRDRFLLQLAGVVALSVALGITAFFAFRFVTERLRAPSAAEREVDVPAVVGPRHEAVPARVEKVAAPVTVVARPAEVARPHQVAAPGEAATAVDDDPPPAEKETSEPSIDGSPVRITPQSGARR